MSQHGLLRSVAALPRTLKGGRATSIAIRLKNSLQNMDRTRRLALCSAVADSEVFRHLFQASLDSLAEPGEGSSTVAKNTTLVSPKSSPKL